ncbi:MAG: protein-glutamate O-methyltransferase CheR [Rhodocyclales bacterium]|nr:protein-glutamate O-methyltransferase CheR [Rhodocyclales bacterium]
MPTPVKESRHVHLTATEAIENVELPLLLEAVYQRYGYDFRDYAPASFKRRVHRAMNEEGLDTVSALQDRILHDPACMVRFLDVLSVDFSAFFRDPAFYKTFRDQAVPLLRSAPRLRIWHAGCAAGEEVYSLAIVLHEEGLLERSRIYATDINEKLLALGREAIFPIKHMREYTTSYHQAGGRGEFSEYFTASPERVIMRDFLRQPIVWAAHNLVSDASFNEFDVVLCRNVMIYFNRRLQDRVLQLIYDSLAIGGFLGLGRGESLQCTAFEARYATLLPGQRLYRKTA